VVVDGRALEPAARTAVDEQLPFEVLDLGGDAVAEPSPSGYSSQRPGSSV
jgi:hypothetical protein